MSNDSPLLMIVSSPSGAGKTTLTNALQAAISRIEFSVSHTTRKPRAGEVSGREYHFVDRAEFERLIREGAFLEWAEVHGNLYGTSTAEITRASCARGLIFDVDYQGARQIKSIRSDAVGVFILPPSLSVLEQRLRGRASDPEDVVARRLDVARQEIEHYGLFDYVIVNDDLELAKLQLQSIFIAEECGRNRSARLAEDLLAAGRGFGGSIPPHS